ncbi:MAG: TldD/PmbA family protein [Candidatus Cloacimonadota bacterium]|nr:TldD/PmbA family protein [Candidatus Cloacimonadota bacterium]
MLNKTLIEKILLQAVSGGADFAEIYSENCFNSSIQLLDSKIKKSVDGFDFGAGIRIFYGKKAIYAYTNDLSEKSLLSLAKTISKADTGKSNITTFNLCEKKIANIHPIEIFPKDVAKAEKVNFLHQVNKFARNHSKFISQVRIIYSEVEKKILVANTEGLLTKDSRNYVRAYATAIAAKNSEMQTGGEGPGAFKGFEFIKNLNPEKIGNEIAKQAVVMLNADYAPSGKFPVIIGNAFGGVIFHEACGHSLETTSVAKGASVFADKMGTQIANKCVTAIDDGTIPNQWGSTNIDDEGNPTQKTVLIKNGILNSFMIDKLGGMKIGMKSTGSGRRESFKFAPTSRMRNTYIAPGKDKIEDMIASVDYGLYAKKMGGGSVQPGTGDFNFAVSEGYLIEHGKITKPVRGASLIGNGANILHKISMIAADLKHAEGMCGSSSGSVPVCVGQPHIKVDEIIVGGRKEN